MVLEVQGIWLTPDFPPFLPSSHQWEAVSLKLVNICWEGNLEYNRHYAVIPKPVRISWETYDYISPIHTPHF